jgi:hypothetical protein
MQHQPQKRINMGLMKFRRVLTNSVRIAFLPIVIISGVLFLLFAGIFFISWSIVFHQEDNFSKRNS